jgi:hypothetical protein
MKKKLSVLFSAALVLCLLSGVTPPAIAAASYDVSAGDIAITTSGDYIVTGSTSAYTVTVSGAVTVNLTLSAVAIDASGLDKPALDIGAGATVNLTLLGNSSLTGGRAGVSVPVGATLSITAASTGSLTAAGGTDVPTGQGGAGIGGYSSGGCGAVTIAGGTVTATGGQSAAGIGGGGCDSINGGAGGTVTITGGTVTATGGNGSAGGAGIGGGGSLGSSGVGGTVIVTGGNVTAVGGGVNYWGAGIGAGGCHNWKIGGALTVSGGTVKATSAGDGIGGASGMNTVVTGGSLYASSSIHPLYCDAARTVRAYPVTVSTGLASAEAAWAPGGGNLSRCTTDAVGKLYLWLPESMPAETGVFVVSGTDVYLAHGAVQTAPMSSADGTNAFDASPLLTGLSQTADFLVPEGGTAQAALSFTPISEDTGVTYQWYADGALIPGAEERVLTIPPAGPGTVYYSCGLSCTVGGNTFTLINDPTAVTAICGNGAFDIVSDGDAAYASGYSGGILNLTVNSGASGFTYFGAAISVRDGHTGTETAVFVHMRGGQQLAVTAVRADFEKLDEAQAGFNVKAGDVIRVFIVDSLTNAAGVNPTVL